MNIGIHTTILESKRLTNIIIVREDPDGYPKGKSNIYAKDFNDKLLWFAELPLSGDIYCNPIQWDKQINEDANNWDNYLSESINSLVVSSWNCITVSISYKDGRIIQKEFSK